MSIAKDKTKYIENLEPGLLVAFETPDGVKSGKVTKIFDDFVEVNEYSGKTFNVVKMNIIWVKTGQRWPKEIFKALRAGDKLECKEID